MRRLILSRKGFDSKAGGSASPIFNDGSFFSIPIPQSHPSPKKYKDLDFNGISGSKLLNEVSAKVRDTDIAITTQCLMKKLAFLAKQVLLRLN